MSPRARLLLASSLAVAALRPSSARAQQEAPTDDEPCAPLTARLDALALTGTARSPYASPEQREVTGYPSTLRIEGHLPVARCLELRFRVPVVTASLRLPAGSLRHEGAWGVPEVGAFWHTRRLDGVGLRAGFALGAPLASGDSGQGQRPRDDQALALATAQSGWHEPELFAAGRLAITPSLSTSVDHGRWHGVGELKAPLGVAVKRGTTDTRVRVLAMSVAVVLGLGGSVELGRWTPALRAWLTAVGQPEAEERGRAVARWHPAVEPSLRVRLGSWVNLSVLSVIALDGRAFSAGLALGLAERSPVPSWW